MDDSDRGTNGSTKRRTSWNKGRSRGWRTGDREESGGEEVQGWASLADNIISNNSRGSDLCGSQVFKNASPLTLLLRAEALSTSRYLCLPPPLPPLPSTGPPPLPSTFRRYLCPSSSLTCLHFLRFHFHFLQSSRSFLYSFPSIPSLNSTSFYLLLPISSSSFLICLHFHPLPSDDPPLLSIIYSLPSSTSPSFNAFIFLHFLLPFFVIFRGCFLSFIHLPLPSVSLHFPPLMYFLLPLIN